jgi:hypothetical protein
MAVDDDPVLITPGDGISWNECQEMGLVDVPWD